MDISTTRRLKARNRVYDPCDARAPASCPLKPFGPRKPARCRRTSSPLVTISNALLIAALLLALAGCAVVQPDTTARTSPVSSPATNSAPTMASVSQKPEAPANPASPVPQPPQRISEPKPPPATASKGAERLAAPATPAVVRAREMPQAKAEPAQPKVPIVADSGAITDAPVRELVFKGPSPKPRTGLSPKKLLGWIGLGLAIGSVAVVGRLCLIRRAEPIKVADDKKEDLMPPEGLLFKESVSSPSESLLVEKS
jgi:hypothetical protein